MTGAPAGTTTIGPAASGDELERIVKEADLGGREPAGAIGRAIALIAGAWSLFQLWYASPLPFVASSA